MGKLLDRFNATTHFAVNLYKGDVLQHVMVFGSREAAELVAELMASKVALKSIERIEINSWKQ